jgi:CheY-like chemotaxis protein
MSDKRAIDVTEELLAPEDRRRQRRVMISTAVRIRNTAADGDRNSEEFTNTVNLSSAGFLIETANQAYQRNMKVAVILPFSETATVKRTEREGTVVRVTELPHGRRAVAIALKVCEEKKEDIAAKKLAHRTPESTLPLVLVLAEQDASRSMKAYLSGEGYDVVAFNNVAEARSLLDECTPALVIAETEGAEMPGYELCLHCKQTPRLKVVPVMLITSSAYPSDYARAHSVGAVVCMAKPYRRERLGHVVRLLAPPRNDDYQAMPPRKADTSRRAGGHRGKIPSSLTAR